MDYIVSKSTSNILRKIAEYKYLITIGINMNNNMSWPQKQKAILEAKLEIINLEFSLLNEKDKEKIQPRITRQQKMIIVAEEYIAAMTFKGQLSYEDLNEKTSFIANCHENITNITYRNETTRV